jgi:hypothetical protein
MSAATAHIRSAPKSPMSANRRSAVFMCPVVSRPRADSAETTRERADGIPADEKVKKRRKSGYAI